MADRKKIVKSSKINTTQCICMTDKEYKDIEDAWTSLGARDIYGEKISLNKLFNSWVLRDLKKPDGMSMSEFLHKKYWLPFIKEVNKQETDKNE